MFEATKNGDGTIHEARCLPLSVAGEVFIQVELKHEFADFAQQDHDILVLRVRNYDFQCCSFLGSYKMPCGA
jgi:hypothetical protein